MKRTNGFYFIRLYNKWVVGEYHHINGWSVCGVEYEITPNEIDEHRIKRFAEANANTVLGDVRPFWRTGLPDKNGRYLVVYRQHKRENIFVMDFDEIEHRWQSLLQDVEILLWAEIPPYVT